MPIDINKSYPKFKKSNIELKKLAENLGIYNDILEKDLLGADSFSSLVNTDSDNYDTEATSDVSDNVPYTEPTVTSKKETVEKPPEELKTNIKSKRKKQPVEKPIKDVAEDVVQKPTSINVSDNPIVLYSEDNLNSLKTNIINSIDTVSNKIDKTINDPYLTAHLEQRGEEKRIYEMKGEYKSYGDFRKRVDDEGVLKAVNAIISNIDDLKTTLAYEDLDPDTIEDVKTYPDYADKYEESMRSILDSVSKGVFFSYVRKSKNSMKKDDAVLRSVLSDLPDIENPSLKKSILKQSISSALKSEGYPDHIIADIKPSIDYYIDNHYGELYDSPNLRNKLSNDERSKYINKYSEVKTIKDIMDIKGLNTPSKINDIEFSSDDYTEYINNFVADLYMNEKTNDSAEAIVAKIFGGNFVKYYNPDYVNAILRGSTDNKKKKLESVYYALDRAGVDASDIGYDYHNLSNDEKQAVYNKLLPEFKRIFNNTKDNKTKNMMVYAISTMDPKNSSTDEETKLVSKLSSVLGRGVSYKRPDGDIAINGRHIINSPLVLDPVLRFEANMISRKVNPDAERTYTEQLSDELVELGTGKFFKGFNQKNAVAQWGEVISAFNNTPFMSRLNEAIKSPEKMNELVDFMINVRKEVGNKTFELIFPHENLRKFLTTPTGSIMVSHKLNPKNVDVSQTASGEISVSVRDAFTPYDKVSWKRHEMMMSELSDKTSDLSEDDKVMKLYPLSVFNEYVPAYNDYKKTKDAKKLSIIRSSMLEQLNDEVPSTDEYKHEPFNFFSDPDKISDTDLKMMVKEFRKILSVMDKDYYNQLNNTSFDENGLSGIVTPVVAEETGVPQETAIEDNIPEAVEELQDEQDIESPSDVEITDEDEESDEGEEAIDDDDKQLIPSEEVEEPSPADIETVSTPENDTIDEEYVESEPVSTDDVETGEEMEETAEISPDEVYRDISDVYNEQIGDGLSIPESLESTLNTINELDIPEKERIIKSLDSLSSFFEEYRRKEGVKTPELDKHYMGREYVNSGWLYNDYLSYNDLEDKANTNIGDRLVKKIVDSIIEPYDRAVLRFPIGKTIDSNLINKFTNYEKVGENELQDIINIFDAMDSVPVDMSKVGILNTNINPHTYITDGDKRIRLISREQIYDHIGDMIEGDQKSIAKILEGADEDTINRASSDLVELYKCVNAEEQAAKLMSGLILYNELNGSRNSPVFYPENHLSNSMNIILFMMHGLDDRISKFKDIVRLSKDVPMCKKFLDEIDFQIDKMIENGIIDNIPGIKSKIYDAFGPTDDSSEREAELNALSKISGKIETTDDMQTLTSFGSVDGIDFDLNSNTAKLLFSYDKDINQKIDHAGKIVDMVRASDLYGSSTLTKELADSALLTGYFLDRFTNFVGVDTNSIATTDPKRNMKIGKMIGKKINKTINGKRMIKVVESICMAKTDSTNVILTKDKPFRVAMNEVFSELIKSRGDEIAITALKESGFDTSGDELLNIPPTVFSIISEKRNKDPSVINTVDFEPRKKEQPLIEHREKEKPVKMVDKIEEAITDEKPFLANDNDFQNTIIDLKDAVKENDTTEIKEKLNELESVVGNISDETMEEVVELKDTIESSNDTNPIVEQIEDANREIKHEIKASEIVSNYTDMFKKIAKEGVQKGKMVAADRTTLSRYTNDMRNAVVELNLGKLLTAGDKIKSNFIDTGLLRFVDISAYPEFKQIIDKKLHDEIDKIANKYNITPEYLTEDDEEYTSFVETYIDPNDMKKLNELKTYEPTLTTFYVEMMNDLEEDMKDAGEAIGVDIYEGRKRVDELSNYQSKLDMVDSIISEMKNDLQPLVSDENAEAFDKEMKLFKEAVLSGNRDSANTSRDKMQEMVGDTVKLRDIMHDNQIFQYLDMMYGNTNKRKKEEE